MNQRLDPKERTEQILKVAVALAAKKGLAQLTRAQIADAAGVTHGLVTIRFGGMPALRDAIVDRAVRDRVLKVVWEALALGNERAKRAPRELRQAAAAAMVR